MEAASHAVERHAKGDPPRDGDPRGHADVDGDDGVDRARAIRCAGCLAELARPAAAIEVNGRHEHVFMNPAGQVFHVRCFDVVTGAVVRGEPSTAYTWFPPHPWRFAHCRACGRQLGWSFEVFFGLMREMLVDDDG